MNIIKIMPQLMPFFFVNQVIFTFIFLTIVIYIFSKYILPKFVRLFILRIYINKL
jgi:F-type H+-transporting ATPase subunit 8